MTASGNFDPAYFRPLSAAEALHFWFRARNRVIAEILRQVTRSLPNGYRVLEVGCGTGNVLRVLENVCSRGTVVGMDLFAEGLHFARSRTACALVLGDMNHPPFRAHFDLIGLFDVLEHLPDDRQALSDLHGLLAPGGRLILTVPAFPFLWSYFDRVSYHCRRYGLDDLEDKLTQAGYSVEYLTPYMTSLFPAVWLRRFARKARAADVPALGGLRIVPGLNELLYRLLSLEIPFLVRRRRLPLGASLLTVARKRMD
jgi:SAM-dependent methyltransferase